MALRIAQTAHSDAGQLGSIKVLRWRRGRGQKSIAPPALRAGCSICKIHAVFRHALRRRRARPSKVDTERCRSEQLISRCARRTRNDSSITSSERQKVFPRKLSSRQSRAIILGLRRHAKDIPVPYLGDVRPRVACGKQALGDSRIGRHVFHSDHPAAAIHVRADADMIDADDS